MQLLFQFISVCTWYKQTKPNQTKKKKKLRNSHQKNQRVIIIKQSSMQKIWNRKAQQIC